MEDLHPALEPLDFTEALKDSPRFRWSLAQHESYLALLESKLKEVLKQCHQMVENGKAYVASFHSMLEAVSDLNGTCFKTDSTVFTAIDTLSTAFGEVAKFQKVLIEQAHWSITKNIGDFNKRELNKAHEMRVHFLRVGQSLDDALTKNAQINKNKEQESCEARNELTAVGTCFAHTALDYVFQINMVQSRKKYEILEALLSFLRAYQTFFHQGTDLFTGDWEPTANGLDETIGTLKQGSKQVERKMQDRHMLVPKEVFQHPAGMPLDPDVVMEGYLFKRASNAFKTWNSTRKPGTRRRWFLIRDNKLLYCHRETDSDKTEKSQMTDDGYTIMEIDLRLCLVRSAPNNVERRHCFELVTPLKNHLLQADSESLCNAWIKALQRSIESALHDSTLSERALDDRYSDSDRFSTNSASAAVGVDEKRASSNQLSGDTTPKVITTSGGVVVSGAPKNHAGASSAPSSASATPPKKRRIVDEIIGVPGNELCADCGAPDPRWASVNLGITLCIECGASHRSLGVQVTKVRSLTLDAWEPEQVKVMMALGNRKVNEVYLTYLSPTLSVPPPAKPNSSRPARDAWIRAKYVDRQFVFPERRKLSSTNAGIAAAATTANSTTAAPTVVRFRKHKSGSKMQLARRFRIDSRNRTTEMTFANEDEKKSRKPRTTRAKSMAQDSSSPASSQSTYEQMLRNSIRLLSVRQYCSSPNLHKIDENDENGEAVFGADPPFGISSAYGSESMLNQAQHDGAESCDEDSRAAENRRLVQAARSADMRAMGDSLARAADVNFADLDDPDHTTPLHAAINSGSVEALEYLLLNGAKINIQDARGRTPLYLACQLANTAQVCLLLKRGASQELSTITGETALGISMDLTNADIVTLLRLAKLNEEIKETEFNGGDDTFVEVVRDISLMASNRPQMLKRQQPPSPQDSI